MESPIKHNETAAPVEAQEPTVPQPRVPEQGTVQPLDKARNPAIDFERAAKIRALLIKIDIKLKALYAQLEAFDKDNEVPDYNQKALAGDNPIVFNRRRVLVTELNKYEALKARLIAESL